MDGIRQSRSATSIRHTEIVGTASNLIPRGNNSVNARDPSGQILDLITDDGWIAFDLRELATDLSVGARLVAERNAAFLQVSYHYDDAGRLLNRILSNGAQTDYAYDAGHRLVSLNQVAADGSTVQTTAYTHPSSPRPLYLTECLLIGPKENAA